MLSADSSIERVWACILRYSWGWRSLFAILVKDYGKASESRAPLLQVGLVALLPGLTKQDVSKAVVRLKELGWLEERAKLLYPVAVPKRKRKPLSGDDGDQLSLPFMRWVEDVWKDLSPDSYQQLKDTRAAYLQALERAKSEYKVANGATFSTVATEVPKVLNGERKSREWSDKNERLYIRSTDKTDKPIGAPAVSGGFVTAVKARASSSSSVSVVVKTAFATWAPADDEAIQTLVKTCRKIHPPITDAEIVFFIDQKGALILRGGVDNPTGFLLKAVPRAISGKLSQLRARGTEI